MRSGASSMDVSVIRASVDSVELISRYVELKRAGSEWEGLCPFHSERSPSFKVNPTKGFCHCFGCGAHHDVIGFLMRIENLPFRDACRQLSGAKPGSNTARVKPKRASLPPERWIPVYPVPDYAPLIAAGIRCPVWNGKRGHVWKILATRADPYRDAAGRLMGYVLRVEFEDGVKITPCVTWCIGRDGTARWCVRPFQSPRPLCGLDELAARPDAPVLVVEGEKCKAI
ncbi:MAG: CHC2 zinc finger domain-containing protein, partial [Dokdonella sp.]